MQLDREEQFEQQEQNNQNPTVDLSNIIDKHFKHVNTTIKKYLTPRLLKMQHRQINESLLYRSIKIEDWEKLLNCKVIKSFL